MKTRYVVKATLADGGNPEFAPVESAEQGITCRGYCLLTVSEEGEKNIVIDGMSTMDLAMFFNRMDGLILCQAAAIGEGMMKAKAMEREANEAKQKARQRMVEMSRKDFLEFLRDIGAGEDEDAEE